MVMRQPVFFNTLKIDHKDDFSLDRDSVQQTDAARLDQSFYGCRCRRPKRFTTPCQFGLIICNQLAAECHQFESQR